MVRKIKKTQSITGNALLLAVASATLVACGGGSSTGTGTDIDGGNETFVIFDADNDGIEDAIDLDADGDGLADSDSNDVFIDLDGDGLDDFSFNSLGEAYVGVTGGEDLVSVTLDDVCGSVSGSDAFSDNPFWNDNCFIERSISAGGIFADSLYSVGIQRILFCSGFAETAGQSYVDFADGEYGPASETAMRAFQASAPGPITDDGIVGRDTWAKLQDALVFDTAAVQVVTQSIQGTDVERDAYSYIAGPCAGIVLFYQDVVDNGDFRTLGAWRLAKNTPNQDQAIAFSIEPPFSGRLD